MCYSYVHTYMCVYIYMYMYFQENSYVSPFFFFFLKRLDTKENMHDHGKSGAYFYLIVVVILQKSGKRPHSTSTGG